MLEDMMEALEAMLPQGWSIYDPEYFPDSNLECPHGNVIELDGHCPDGCTSPLITLGLI